MPEDQGFYYSFKIYLRLWFAQIVLLFINETLQFKIKDSLQYNTIITCWNKSGKKWRLKAYEHKKHWNGYLCVLPFGRRLQYLGTKRREYIYARKMQSNRGDLGTDDNCYFKNIYKTKHFLYLYPGFAEEQAVGDGHLTLIEVNMF